MSQKKDAAKVSNEKEQLESNLKEGELDVNTSTSAPEISEESKIDRAVTTNLIFKRSKEETAEAVKRKKDRKEQEIELLNGTKTTVEELCPYVVSKKRPYASLFPNNNSFFKELFRINGWHHLDPNEYIKPKIVSKMIDALIYNRFASEVLPNLRKLNPLLANGFRKYKLFEYLDDEGQEIVLQFRNEAIAEMEKSTTNCEFRKRMYHKYGVPYQTTIFDKD